MSKQFQIFDKSENFYNTDSNTILYLDFFSNWVKFFAGEISAPKSVDKIVSSADFPDCIRKRLTHFVQFQTS